MSGKHKHSAGKHGHGSHESLETAAAAQVPLVVGITGHRDIPESAIPGLQAKIKSLLLNLKSKYRATPVILLSALAEGADQLAARVAVSEDVGISLFVALPMPREIYEHDFEGHALASFRDLAAKANSLIELPLVPGNSRDSISRQGPERDLQYESVGKYIVEKSQVLIALWDGTDNHLMAGTASVVRFQREGIPSPDPCALEPPECFPVYHLLTPRKKNPYPAGEAVRWLYPSAFGDNETKAREYFERILSQIDEFNSQVVNPDAELRSAMLQSKKYLRGDCHEDEFAARCSAEMERYVIADALALRFQRERIRAQKLLHVSVFLSFLFFVFFADIKGHREEFLLISSIFLAGAYFLNKWFKDSHRDTKYEEYRALAEGLRVEVFWRMAGILDSVADYYLWKQRTELDWIRTVFRGWRATSGIAPGAVSHAEIKDIERVRKYWVEDQGKYFARASKREEERREKIERVEGFYALWALCLTVISLAVFLIVGLFLERKGMSLRESPWIDVAIIAVDLILAGAALLHHFGDRMAYSEHAKQYSRMGMVFSRASANLDGLIAKNDAAGAAKCLKKLGREALEENGDWVLIHRERPLEMPHP